VPPGEPFREIRGVEQRRRAETRHWFQAPWFDLFLTRSREGEVQWFQLCYARDTARERVLEWRRGRGFQHLKPRERLEATRYDVGELVLDGVMPYAELMASFETAAPGLPPDLASLVAEKVREFARPARKFRPPSARTPRWLERMRERSRTQARLAFLDSVEADR
jgi:hypothetical protein